MITVLVNPISGGGKAQKALYGIEEVLKQENKAYIIKETRMPGEATRISEEAVRDKHEAIVVAGGDGTMSEVLLGVKGSDVSVIFAPCGTGNDFVKCLDIPSDPVSAIKKQLSSPVRRLDYATVNERAFLNVCGAGFDVEVLKHFESHRHNVAGMKAYLLAIKDAFNDYKPMEVMISVDDRPFEEKRLAILSIGNGVYFGGGMKAVPGALPNDGELNLVMVNAIKKWMIPFLLPLFISGLHTKLKITTTMACKRVKITSNGLTMQLDGEIIQMENADVKIVPAGVCARY